MPKATHAAYDAAALERVALHYAGRYATTRAKLAAYLHRKLRERGWAGEGEAPVDSLVERFAQRGYVNDALFAQTRADNLLRRGYGARRVRANLQAAGIDRETIGAACSDDTETAQAAALTFARRRKLGPFAQEPQDSAEKRRSLAAMLRAGHAYDVSLWVIGSATGDEDIDSAFDPRDGDA
ncbi:MAG: hypothetical protein JWR77_355 [Rhizorhabdus sp.]|nr:hypothetical protein [Rhizorhabdus sp.]